MTDLMAEEDFGLGDAVMVQAPGVPVLFATVTGVIQGEGDMGNTYFARSPSMPGATLELFRHHLWRLPDGTVSEPACRFPRGGKA